MDRALPQGPASRLGSGSGPLEAARRLLAALGVPAAYLDPRGDHEPWAGGARPRAAGAPPEAYAAPAGWVRVGVRVDGAVAGGERVWAEWAVTFRGTSREAVRRAVVSRALLPPGAADATGRAVAPAPGLFGGQALPPGGRYVVTADPSGAGRAALVAVRGGVDRPKGRGGAGDGGPPRGAEAFEPGRYAFTTPSVTYAGLPCHAPPFDFDGRRAQVASLPGRRPDTERKRRAGRVPARRGPVRSAAH
jgi:hypothetical protein